MKPRLACADFTFPLLSHDHALDLIARIGVEGVDIGLFAGRSHLRPENAFRDVAGAARELREKVRSRGLEVADIFLIPAEDFRTLAANHPEPTERARSRDVFRRALDFTVECDAKHMSGLPGVTWETDAGDDSFKRAADDLAWRVETAGDMGITFSVEAHLGSLVPTPAEAKRLVEMTPNLTLTLDYGHFTYQGIPDVDIEPLIAVASHFHARCGCKGRLQASLSHNTIDYIRILKEMKRVHYSGFVGLEYVWVDWEHCNEVDNLSETILLRDLLLKNL